MTTLTAGFFARVLSMIAWRLLRGFLGRQAAQAVVAAEFEHQHVDRTRCSSQSMRRNPPAVVSPLRPAFTTW